MQTTYTANPELGFPGQPADNGIKDDVSGIAEEVIPPGLVVLRGTDPDRQARLPGSSDTTAAAVLGVSVRSHVMADDDGYAEGQALPIRRFGRVLVRCETAFTPASAVFFRIAAGTDPAHTQAGAIRTDADGSAPATAVAWTAAKFRNSGSAGDIAVLDILHH